MRIAILASEGAPYIKSGGLGDVMEALPAALARIPGNEVILILPYYHKIKENPKFETEYDIEMSAHLEAMGMPDAFDYRVADFSRMGTYTGEDVNICIDRVIHKTFISVAEKGTKAGAATVVEMVTEGAMFVEDYREVVLDRPFVYMLIDCETNLPFFIGTMMNVEGN